MGIIGDQHFSPKFRLTTLDEISRLLFEHRVVVGYDNQLLVAEAFCVCDVGEVRVPLHAGFTNYKRFIQLRKTSDIV